MSQVDSFFDVPVVVIIFNRPEKFRRLWTQIELLKPSKLYVISDGPRSAQDRDLIDACRLLAEPSWQCEVTKIFSEVNLGCRNRIVTGLTEVFNREEMAIVLEDDCIPRTTFFAYCKELLELYRDDPKVFSIAGTNTFVKECQEATKSTSVLLSRYFCSWGWAAWRRSWFSCKWDEALEPNIVDRLGQYPLNSWCSVFWKDLFGSAKNWSDLSWDYQFGFTGLCAGSYTVVPEENLVDNIGCDETATHTTVNFFGPPPISKEIPLPLRLPDQLVPSDEFDNLFELRHTDGRMIRRIRAKLSLRKRLDFLRKALTQTSTDRP